MESGVGPDVSQQSCCYQCSKPRRYLWCVSHMAPSLAIHFFLWAHSVYSLSSTRGKETHRKCQGAALPTTTAHAGHEHNDCPDGHRQGLPTGGRLLLIVKLSPKFGSCIFHVPRGTLPSFHRKPESSDFCPVFNFCLIGQGML